MMSDTDFRLPIAITRLYVLCACLYVLCAFDIGLISLYYFTELLALITIR